MFICCMNNNNDDDNNNHHNRNSNNELYSDLDMIYYMKLKFITSILVYMYIYTYVYHIYTQLNYMQKSQSQNGEHQMAGSPDSIPQMGRPHTLLFSTHT